MSDIVEYRATWDKYLNQEDIGADAASNSKHTMLLMNMYSDIFYMNILVQLHN